MRENALAACLERGVSPRRASRASGGGFGAWGHGVGRFLGAFALGTLARAPACCQEAGSRVGGFWAGLGSYQPTFGFGFALRVQLAHRLPLELDPVCAVHDTVTDRIGDEQMAAAMIDRLVHHGHLIMFGTKSYRMTHALMRHQAPTAAARRKEAV